MGANKVGAADLRWIFRPSPHRDLKVQALAGLPVHAVKAAGPDGLSDVVLSDGTRLRATTAEIVAE